MKKNNSVIIKMIFCFILVLIYQFANLTDSWAQYPGINDSIAKLREGVLTIKAKPGDQVIVEQLTHEFWFGCAITNSIIEGRGMSESDIRQYKEHFLKNFNSAVTENAVKWLSCLLYTSRCV